MAERSRRRLVLLTALSTAAGIAVLGVLIAVAVVWGGLYNISATTQHLQITYSIFEMAMKQSVRLRAPEVSAPELLRDEQRVLRGAACFQANCVQCHGAPGIAPDPIGRSMQPLPGPLHLAAHHWTPGELYWITRHGIKMSGMPAWEFRLEDADIWSIVAFLNQLPEMRPSEYRALVAPMEGLQCTRE